MGRYRLEWSIYCGAAEHRAWCADDTEIACLSLRGHDADAERRAACVVSDALGGISGGRSLDAVVGLSVAGRYALRGAECADRARAPFDAGAALAGLRA